ncbi:hypothetical protein V6S67_13900 [Arthrobacter sp. Soc17.1.1.1]|uniref:hypothetical protein n=1 Tax=Arthrobacter sp. Soc17.1.1.1 TaxID=3121277 RepID=UPI002FE4613D
MHGSTESDGVMIRRDFTIRHDDGILEVIWRPGIGVDPAVLDVLANTITHFPDWHRAPMLVHLNVIRHITPHARQMLIAYRHLGPIGLTGRDPVDRVLAAFIAQSRSRTRYFLETADARAWLSSVPAPAPRSTAPVDA